MAVGRKGPLGFWSVVAIGVGGMGCPRRSCPASPSWKPSMGFGGRFLLTFTKNKYGQSTLKEPFSWQDSRKKA